MAKGIAVRERLSIDVLSSEHRRIKAYAALHGETIREYVLRSIREQLRRESELKELSALTSQLSTDTVLKEVWDNRKDAAYDKL